MEAVPEHAALPVMISEDGSRTACSSPVLTTCDSELEAPPPPPPPLLLLTNPTECFFAIQVPPIEAVPEHAALPVMISEDVPEQPAPAQY